MEESFAPDLLNNTIINFTLSSSFDKKEVDVVKFTLKFDTWSLSLYLVSGRSNELVGDEPIDWMARADVHANQKILEKL